MASIPSLPLIVETTTTDNVIFHCGIRRSGLYSFSYRPRKFSNYVAFNASTFGYSRGMKESSDRLGVCCERLISGRNKGRLRRIERTKVAENRSVEGDGSNESEDALQAKIEKGQKVLAVQRELLQKDILKRMILFCKAAAEVPWYVPCGGVCYGDGNLVFIANDWHTALLPVYLKAYYRDNGLMKYTRSILVIHNIAHQGRCPVDDFVYVDLPEDYKDLFKMYDPVGGEHFNIFAAGLKTADRVVTVSHGYAWELKTWEGGWGLHGIINENDWKLKGIVNGIDKKEWNPEVDVHLTSDGYTYSLETLHMGKPQCKRALQRELNLPIREDVPLIGFIGRLEPQKGVDIIAEAVPWLMDQDVQLVMLGSGRRDLEQMLRQFEKQYHDKVRGWVGFSVRTAHWITAGADVLLMPSRFEPCGLNQLYAISYGTVPVVHAVGGLRDTVQPFDPFSESGLGWTFDQADTCIGKLLTDSTKRVGKGFRGVG